MSTSPAGDDTIPALQAVPDRRKSAGIQLLVSIRNPAEARTVMDAGVDWIDLKEPGAGPLGAAEAEVAKQVSKVLWSHPLRSAALGELRDLGDRSAVHMAELFPTLKVGLSGVGMSADWRPRLRRVASLIAAAGARLVPVIYADWRDCDAPSPQEIIEFCSDLGATSALIDTYAKQGNDVFTWMPAEQVNSIVRQLSESGCGVVLAGSLKYGMLDKLLELPVQAIGVRGAVCGGDRTGSLCPKKLESWVTRFNSL